MCKLLLFVLTICAISGGVIAEEVETTTSESEKTTELLGYVNITTVDAEFANETLNATNSLNATTDALITDDGENSTSSTSDELEGHGQVLQETQPVHESPEDDEEIIADSHTTDQPDSTDQTEQPQETENPQAVSQHSDHNDSQRGEQEEHQRTDEEQQHQEDQKAHVDQQAQSNDDIKPKVSVQSTFKFTQEKRCFDFLRRLKSKAWNEHRDHPLTCPQAFDGILCWRPADPSESLLQLCPDGPSDLQHHVKRECGVDGKWRIYSPEVNKGIEPAITDHTSNYQECFQVEGFNKKHVPSSERTANSAEQRGGSGTEYYFLTTTTFLLAEDVIEINSSQPPVTLAMPNKPDQDIDGDSPPTTPWQFSDSKDCDSFLVKYNLTDTKEGTWCPGSNDGNFCWPPTAPNTIARQPCRKPSGQEDPSQIVQATRQCGEGGQWSSAVIDNCNALIEVDSNVETTSTIITVAEDGVTGSTMALTSNLQESSRHAPKQPWVFGDTAKCEQFLKDIAQWDGQADSCRGESDGNICWPTTAKNTTTTQPCPDLGCLDLKKNVTRRCGNDGKWTQPKGDYKQCFNQQITELIDIHYADRSKLPSSGITNHAAFLSIVAMFLLGCFL